jgi:phosphate transport system permease protein
MFVAIIATGYIAYQLGPVRGLLFYGDFKAWTDGQMGTGTPFMFLIMLPLSFLWSATRSAALWPSLPHVPAQPRRRPRAGSTSCAGALMLAAAMLASFSFASFLTLIGYDPRGSFIDTYAQRNALVVGFVMAFAVIPNIYTLAEDALNAVPGHLRAGSSPPAPRPGRRRSGSSCRPPPPASSRP